MKISSIISVVDDDASVREATSGLLRALGYEVRSFGSAEDFLASDGLDETGCLITDLAMPGLDGFALQARLRAAGHMMPVIYVTSFATDTNRKCALAAGASGFFGKPFNDDRLAECLSNVLPAPHG